jgi:leader peptidase (prepilin peptidase)/N-methyltransferase
LVEGGTGALFAYAGFHWGLTPLSLISLLYISVLVVIFVIDLEEKLILNRVVYPAMGVAFLLSPWGPAGAGARIWEGFVLSIAGGLIAFAVMFFIYLAARGGMGAGDVKLAAFLGLALGVPLVLVCLPVSFIAGGIVAVVLLIARVRARREAIPFGPFLSGGAVVALFWGHTIFQWYKGLFGLP